MFHPTRMIKSKKYIYFTWVDSVHTLVQTFHSHQIRLYRRIFIITLNMNKLQKYSYTLNISYRIIKATKEVMNEGHHNISYPPLILIPKR